uniref:acetyl-CoA C-acyltransferase n=1 Tax=Pseudo-nitzschia australis TaxID=44445 RepID=A0A7S4ERJ4_9STRA|mmetsp:Transcript_208/g.501  ORF Transcript_208/g.501 Transcript_208/m.501 type:complete len:398 (+) Transcript_208:94-1287(+)
MSPAATKTPKNPNDVVIVSALRTPMCRSRKGALAKTPPSTLLTTVLEATLKNTGVNGEDIEDLCLGNCLMPPSGYAAMRMGHMVAGIDAETTPLVWVNRQCSSGLQAVANIADAVATKKIQIGIGGGVESMSFYPMNSIKAPDVDWEVMKKAHKQTRVMDCLIPMGLTSDNVVAQYGLDRKDLDAFAVQSHQKAARARASGKFKKEIVPVGNVTEDDGIRPQTTLEILSKLKPIFSKNGKTTAGNSSQTTDGAAAVLVMTRAEAEKRGLRILGIWKGYAVKGVPPRVMGIGPAVAIPAVLKQCNLTVDDIDVWEINEAFASQASWCVDILNIDASKVNPNGGAIALGHPLGCTGARQIATLLNELHRRKERFGVVSMCIGTGMGAAAVLEVETESRL